ncbi:MAG: hypothetical protein NT129_00805 [Candidatus Aenigmarchaeota archaeon]|nr:hypothetical protein [Candidatus Aenigmarchaeota archaeon]
MSNLVWIKNGKIINIIDKPIHPEEEIEKLLYNTKGILQDVILINKKIKSSTGKEIPDLIGIDKENNVIIIELKDEPVTADIMIQVMKYAFWVENNPDSIKALWLEKKDRPEDFTPEWDKLNVKIRIIAPAFKPEFIRLINKIGYDFELTEIKRFIEGEDTFVLFNTIETIEEKPKKTARGTGTYDRQFYEGEGYNRQGIDIFFRKVEEIENLVKEKAWDLTVNYNKGYVSFKYGFPIVFGVTFITSKTVCIFFKITKKLAVDIQKNKKIEIFRYEGQWKEARYKIDSVDFSVKKLLPLFEAAYDYIVGNKN